MIERPNASALDWGLTGGRGTGSAQKGSQVPEIGSKLAV
jgi:hypothetical protein